MKITKALAAALVLLVSPSLSYSAQPTQAGIAPVGTSCNKQTEGYLLGHQLCSDGKWKNLPPLVMWQKGTSIYDESTGCLYQVVKTSSGLETALVGNPNGCGK